ncbi:hypothetical protein HRI_000700100 [Hibiscus trionum]|uniref:DUF4283 domain-containing protein n=1 Tax=Hibiscus trionum TaxID=183268 RepID=A0A9W7LMP6_HIBTR|nr:hypothetical protein HRI_000700100 [Hibiscus trionum]
MPVWFQLFNVPLELYSKAGLSYISSAIGNPLYMDTVTAKLERLEYAKVCVEVSAVSSIPKVIDVMMRDGSIVLVRVIVPWLPPCCSRCSVFGHNDKTCHVSSKGEKQFWKAKTVASGIGGASEVDAGSHSGIADGSTAVLGDSLKDTGAEDVGSGLWELVGHLGSDEGDADIHEHILQAVTSVFQ